MESETTIFANQQLQSNTQSIQTIFQSIIIIKSLQTSSDKGLSESIQLGSGFTKEERSHWIRIFSRN